MEKMDKMATHPRESYYEDIGCDQRIFYRPYVGQRFITHIFVMFIPLSEHIENKLDEAFCQEYNVYGTYERTDEWEGFKEDFAQYLVEKFTGKLLPKKPPDWR